MYTTDNNKAGNRTKYFETFLNGANINVSHPTIIILFKLNRLSIVQKLNIILNNNFEKISRLIDFIVASFNQRNISKNQLCI